jgi:hypothetical protein
MQLGAWEIGLVVFAVILAGMFLKHLMQERKTEEQKEKEITVELLTANLIPSLLRACMSASPDNPELEPAIKRLAQMFFSNGVPKESVEEALYLSPVKNTFRRQEIYSAVLVYYEYREGESRHSWDD